MRWPWLSLLAAQIFLTMMFFAFVVFDTAQVGVEIVKSSNIAELMAINQRRESLDDHLPRGIAGEVVGSFKGRLVRGGGGWNLNVRSPNVVGEAKTAGHKRWSNLFKLENLPRRQQKHRYEESC